MDWKEALGAWGVWVRPALKRDDLPDTIRTIAAGPLALDRELGEDAVMEALLSGDITQVIVSMNKLSIWLATHLTDLMEKLGLIDQPADQARTLRDHFVLEYAMHLGSGEGLWRMTVDYLKTCGEEGRRRAARVLERVSLENETGGIDEDLVEEVFKTLVFFSFFFFFSFLFERSIDVVCPKKNQTAIARVGRRKSNALKSRRSTDDPVETVRRGCRLLHSSRRWKTVGNHL